MFAASSPEQLQHLHRCLIEYMALCVCVPSYKTNHEPLFVALRLTHSHPGAIHRFRALLFAHTQNLLAHLERMDHT